MIWTPFHKVWLFVSSDISKRTNSNKHLYSNSVFSALVEQLLQRSNLLLPSERSDSYVFDLYVEFLRSRSFAKLLFCLFCFHRFITFY